MGRIAEALAVSRRGAALALIAALTLTCGCVASEWSLLKSETVIPPSQMAATWQNHVAFTPDPANGGKMSPGLAGRFYLFGPEIGHPLVGDGKLTVGLFDETKGGSELRDVWNIDAGTLKRLLKKDAIGMGYTLFLPWHRYSPEVTRVRIKIEYTPDKGAPMYTENVVSLAPTNGNIQVTHSAPMSVGVPK